ncbi:hypothetical protein V2J09_003232 [Rumex salicifolius]
MANSATAVHHHHVVAVPYPGRGHINPMLNFCKQLISKSQLITQITVIVTEEWLRYIKSEEPELHNRITFATIPDVLPSEQIRGSDLVGFFKSVQTDMEEPVERALDALGVPPDMIIADSCLGWAFDLSRRRNVKLASFWTASVTSFVLSYHFELLTNFSVETGEERIEIIPGIRSIRVSDLPEGYLNDKTLTSFIVNTLISPATKAQCIIFRSMNELEGQAIKALETDLSNPIFSIGPAIPHFKTIHTTNTTEEPSYMTWLDTQQERSVLYLSLGSFLSASSSQMDELAAGLEESGVPYLWAARDKTCQLSKNLGDQGKVVPWCDQMRVLCHSSVGGFFTHCGWNSAVETAFAGVPALTFPLEADQSINSKIMVEDWGIGRRVMDKASEFVGREEVSQVFRKFMELECSERKELDRACNELKESLLAAVSEDGSTSGFEGHMCMPIALLIGKSVKHNLTVSASTITGKFKSHSRGIRSERRRNQEHNQLHANGEVKTEFTVHCMYVYFLWTPPLLTSPPPAHCPAFLAAFSCSAFASL